MLAAVFYAVQGLFYADFFAYVGLALAPTFPAAMYLRVVFAMIGLSLLLRGFLLFWAFDEPSGPDFYWSAFSAPIWIAAILISLAWGDVRAILFIVVGIINISLVCIKFGLVPKSPRYG